MTMTNLRKVKIDRLQPTQHNLTDDTLLYLEKENHNLERLELPEIHEINGKLYVADGHNKLFFQSVYLGRSKVLCRYFTPESCNSQIASFLEREAEEAKKRGIYRIQDLV